MNLFKKLVNVSSCFLYALMRIQNRLRYRFQDSLSIFNRFTGCTFFAYRVCNPRFYIFLLLNYFFLHSFIFYRCLVKSLICFLFWFTFFCFSKFFYLYKRLLIYFTLLLPYFLRTVLGFFIILKLFRKIVQHIDVL